MTSVQNQRRMKHGRGTGRTAGWWLLILLAFSMAAYSLGYLILGERMYPALLADSFRARPWGIYPHAFFAMLAFAIGPFQFLRSLRTRRRFLHKTLGTVYVMTAFLTGASGLYMAAYAFGGWIAQFGFVGMAGMTLITTTVAYLKIRSATLRRIGGG